MKVAMRAAAIFKLRLESERRPGRAAVRRPNVLGLEVEEPPLVLAGAGALFALWECRRLPAERPAG